MSDPTILDSIGSQADRERNAVRPRLIAFYLTQFHPIPENDAWWGKGFTEWTNVVKAQPLFDGHYQPHLPADFGFYDLRVRATRRDQIRMAKRYGIDGFCYHYYWFSGTRLLDQPLDDMLADPQSDMPFCLCWANENWTRRWDAAEREILIAQQYLPDDDLNFIKGLIPYFSDPRYIRLEGKPFLVVYRPQHLPDPKKTVSVWRDFCRSLGIGGIHVCAALTHGNEDYEQFGFDSGVEFPPHNRTCDNIAYQISFRQAFGGSVYRYQAMAGECLAREYRNRNVFRTVLPSWDNTPRRGNRSVIILDATPTNYEYWLAETIRKTTAEFPGRERFVFINAWNEWAEGCHLEPDKNFQHQFLEATWRAKNGQTKVRGFSDVSTISGADSRRTLVGDLRAVMAYHSLASAGRIIAWIKSYPRIKKLVRWVQRRGR